MQDEKTGADQERDKRKEKELPSAGPHADPSLTNPDATPGAGTLPPVGQDDDPIAPPTG
jgi:hypothetical protein